MILTLASLLGQFERRTFISVLRSACQAQGTSSSQVPPLASPELSSAQRRGQIFQQHSPLLWLPVWLPHLPLGRLAAHSRPDSLVATWLPVRCITHWIRVGGCIVCMLVDWMYASDRIKPSGRTTGCGSGGKSVSLPSKTSGVTK